MNKSGDYIIRETIMGWFAMAFEQREMLGCELILLVDS